MTLTVFASFDYTSAIATALANDDKYRWKRRLQWSLPHRGRQGEQGIQVDFSSCTFYLTYFFNHKVNFEVQQEAYRKPSHYLQKNLQRRIPEIPGFIDRNDFTIEKSSYWWRNVSAMEKTDRALINLERLVPGSSLFWRGLRCEGWRERGGDTRDPPANSLHPE